MISSREGGEALSDGEMEGKVGGKERMIDEAQVKVG